jgi:hypothetical protein
MSILLLVAGMAMAKPSNQLHSLAPAQQHVDIVGNVEGTAPTVSKAAADTTWIATWDFEGCDDTGWVRSDFRVLNDGSVYWYVDNAYAGLANISGNGAVLSGHDICWGDYPDGYDNDWYQGICITYTGDQQIAFDYVVDSEGGFDFLQVETDSACSSFGQVDYSVDPEGNAAAFRDLLWSQSGFDTTSARSDTIAISGYGTGDTHCVYISFLADGAYSPADGLQPSVIGAAVVIDNVEILGGLFEDFESTLDPAVTFVNMQDSTPFGQWARVFSHITDNDICSENPTCAWLDTDDSPGTIANDPSVAFAPGQYVIKNWWDEIVIGPWVSLSSTPTAISTLLQIRRFPGNFFDRSRAVQNWSVRGREKVANTDTPAPGDSVDCVSSWGHVFNWNSLGAFFWGTSTWDMTAYFEPTAADLQVRFRQSDWQWIAGASPPVPFIPGPGPFWDRVRIGRQVLSGPVINEGIDARYQGQDAAPNDPTFESGPNYTQATGGDIFGTTAFSRSTDDGINKQSANLIVGDSITVSVQDVLGNGGLTVEVYASIVAGPHAGKAPSPYTVGANGFFVITADSARTANGIILADAYFVDMDDTYFRGGDVLRYYWWSTDAQGGMTSHPAGVNGVPASVAEAEAETGGLFEVNFLPTINWDPTYLAAIAADPNGDIDPSPTQIANSSQKNCILYYSHVNSRRYSGDQNRTSFMYTLDKLGYKGSYDVYDHQGFGNSNNQLGSRMSPEQARDYSLLVYDVGQRSAGWPILPDGVDIDGSKINMQSWFQTWNTLSGSPNAEHTLWIISANAMEEKPTNPLYTTDMAATFGAADQAQDANPDVFGVANFNHHTNPSPNPPTVFVGDLFSLNGGCPVIRDYDDIGASGTGVVTHRYGKGSVGTPGAVVMNANAAGFSTILQTFPWFDIRSAIGQGPTTADEQLMSKVLSMALAPACLEPVDPTDVPEDQDQVEKVPSRTALFQNNPNPFNPMTTIKFDLARDSHVSLKIYDVAGRLVRSLANEQMAAGFGKQVVWNGLDNSGNRVSSGVYFYRLVAADFTATKKMVVMK